jgi:hypothetical protein
MTVDVHVTRPSRPLWVYIAAFAALVIIIGALASYSKSPSAGEMKLNNFWKYELQRWERCEPKSSPRMCGEQYFDCNYTTKTCQRGYRYSGISFLFVVLDEDRKTEISHLFCSFGTNTQHCLSFDTGQAESKRLSDGETLVNFTLREDIPQNCLDGSVTAPCDMWVANTFFRRTDS